MVKKRVTVRNQSGLHLRPAQVLCMKAMEYDGTRIMLQFRDREFNAKSMLSILSACVQQTDEIELVCTGPDEERAAAELSELIEKELEGAEEL